MYGFHDHKEHHQSLTRDADGFFRLPDDAPIDIQGFVNRAHVMRADHMAETMRTLARGARARLRSAAQAVASAPASRPLNRFGQSPNWF